MSHDVVSLELPAENAVMPVVRMVVGGMATRVDLSLDELEDLYLAVETVLGAVPKTHGDGRYSIHLDTPDETIHIKIGPYRRDELDRVLEDACIQLMKRVVDIHVAGEGEQAHVLITKRGSAHSS
jgi:hypothetical protein